MEWLRGGSSGHGRLDGDDGHEVVAEGTINTLYPFKAFAFIYPIVYQPCSALDSQREPLMPHVRYSDLLRPHTLSYSVLHTAELGRHPSNPKVTIWKERTECLGSAVTLHVHDALLEASSKRHLNLKS